jgi:hypothetical protein
MHNIEEIVRNVERHGDNDQYSNNELVNNKKMKTLRSHSIMVVWYTRLFTMVKLFQLKASVGCSDYSFKNLLTLLKDMLHQGNTVSEIVYEIK